VRKAIFITLSALVMLSAGWAQDAMLGPHNTNNTFGCQSCHSPHSSILGGQGLYMWAVNVTTNSYTTYQGTNLTSNLQSGVVPTTTQAHTILCLSCHDAAFNTAMNLAPGLSGGPATGGYSTQTAVPVGSSGALKAGHSELVSVTGDVGTGASFANNHPVNVLYPNGSASASGTYPATTRVKFWVALPGSAVAGDVPFLDTTKGAYTYGHAVRLFTADGANAYVECGSCHDPHSIALNKVNVNGTWYPFQTAHFLRGQYTTAADIAGFCMSCHADKSAAWDGSGTQ